MMRYQRVHSTFHILGLSYFLSVELYYLILQIDQFMAQKTFSINSFQYFLDIANASIFSTPINFTTKYKQIEHYQRIIKDQHNIKQLIFQTIQNELNHANEKPIQQIIAGCGFSIQHIQPIKQLLKFKYTDYKNECIRKQIVMGSKYSTYINWKIKSVLGCSQFTHKNRVILKIDIGLAVGNNAQQEQPISLELSVQQARQVLGKLKEILRQIKEIN